LAPQLTAPPPPGWWSQARQELSAADPVLARLIAGFGDAALGSRGDPFTTLARSIVGQQISVKAAQSVWDRFAVEVARTQEADPRKPGDQSALMAVPPVAVTPSAVMAMNLAQLRACGLSLRKAEYLGDLAQRFDQGDLLPERWPTMDDEAVIAELICVRGIGRWTAEMFLIFNLLRPDVLPLDDIGLLRAMGIHWLQGVTPTRAQARDLAQRWSPWRTAATWYLWRSLDPVPVEY
jgi:DNA-3-methyladenine glycosylase II